MPAKTNGHIPLIKAKDVTARMDDGDEVARLAAEYHQAFVRKAFTDATSAGVDVTFDLEMEEVQGVLGKLAKDIRRVAESTRDDVRRLVGQQAENGWSAEDLAKRILEMGEINSKSRATMISRTESGLGYNHGAIAAYRAGGITHVEVLDGDDDEPCASANGSRWTLEEAEENPLGHPNCTRAFSPIVE